MQCAARFKTQSLGERLVGASWSRVVVLLALYRTWFRLTPCGFRLITEVAEKKISSVKAWLTEPLKCRSYGTRACRAKKE
ncbi:hypothetical protein ATANTOWER_007827 [Ataeniobius toweri]|uniref:Uncharacterized protein n=1 Tax=Ataeniobius toweri TaxID=208326 RepID=A0ABU7BHE6_9TELE|nr:hypothetical protein [Ataeniobius toweri]